MPVDNLYKDIPLRLAEELCENIGGNTHVRIERIVSRGHCSPADFWYDQEEHEFVALLSGAARLELQGPHEFVELKPGDYFTIDAHRRHRVVWTLPEQDSVWLAVFFPPERGSPPVVAEV